MTSSSYYKHLRVRHYEVNEAGEPHLTALLHYCEEAAVAVSTAYGYTPQWYLDHDAAWVIRRLRGEFVGAAQAGDDLTVETWISTMQRVRAYREYIIHHNATQRPIAFLQADWVYVDRTSHLPKRIPDEAFRIFPPTGRVALPRRATPSALRPVGGFKGVGPSPSSPFGQPRAWIRQVERADLDAMHHVNNAVYVAWAEQAAHRHLSDMGWGVLQWREQGLRLVTYRMDLEYVQAAHLDDIIVVATRPWIRHYTLIWQIVMHRGTDELVRGSLWQCAIDGQRWVRALPFDLRARLAPSATDSGTHRL